MFHYNNVNDILYLRFGDSSSSTVQPSHLDEPPAFSGGLSYMSQGNWSSEMESNLRKARQIAVESSELRMENNNLELSLNEISMLCSCLQENLEVFYLIDYEFNSRHSDKICSKRLVLVDRMEAVGLREPDMVYGTGAVYW